MKLLVIGLDGLSFDTFEGADMPFLHALAAQGVRARLISFPEPLTCTGPVWTSVQTGLEPREHGVMGPEAVGWHTAAFKPGVKTIWHTLNERGITCGLVNFPVTYPLRPVERFVVCGFPAPWEHEGTRNAWEKVPGGGALCWPDEVGRHIGGFRSAWMNYVQPEEFQDTSVPYLRALEDDWDARRYFMGLLYRSLHETAALTHRLMGSYAVDLLVSVFMETDSVGHLGSSLPDVERQAFLHEADEVVWSVVSQADPQNVIVMSDHGCWGEKHTREGVFIATGPAFGSAQDARVEVLEVAPTILYVLGAYDARLPREPAYSAFASDRIGEEESEGICQRLRAMGYVD
jgi:hypothetical protein